MKIAMAALAATMTVAPAMAAPTYTFNTVGNTSVNGTYGDAITFSPTTLSTLQLSVTGWQSNLFTNTVTSAYLGAYAGGLGVTGAGDAKGASGLHQIDSVGFYTDFVLLEFNRPVTLTSITTNSYSIGGLSANNAVWFGTSNAVTPAWNSTVGFANYAVSPSLWGNVAAGASGATRMTGATTASTKWLVGAALGPLNSVDAFKLSSITVTDSVAAVPEPATWATMIIGFGAAGVALRRRRVAGRGKLAHA